MRFLPLLGLAAVSVWLGGCGYPADPQPPALNRPTPVTDLAAVERGTHIVVTYTKPAVTTEGLPIKGGGDVELRIGTMPPGRFTLPEWERTSERLSGNVADASKYYGQTAVIAVRVKGARGQNAGWSNFISLPVVPALATPEGLEAKNAPDAVQLTWRGTAPLFRIFRKLADEKNWALLATSGSPTYTDSTIEYGKTYDYYVQAAQKTGDSFAESEISKPVEIAPVDTFPPAVPSGITVAAGTRTMELLWDRNTEKDFASYTIYRDGKKIVDSLKSPAYSDKDVKPGVRYSYQITATDNKGNESPRSNPLEAVIP